MVDEGLQAELAEFLNWRASRDWWTTCDLCRERIRRASAWAWVRNSQGEHVRACFELPR